MKTFFVMVIYVSLLCNTNNGHCVDFVRGDCNASGSIDITDPILLLSWLFLGEAEPPCLSACDADDSGNLTITRAVYLLSWLFLGGPTPPPPNTCGIDPAPDVLTCVDFPPCPPREPEISVPYRPFAILPPGHIMMPDGIFDTFFDKWLMGFYIENTGLVDLGNLSVSVQSIADPEIASVACSVAPFPWKFQIPNNPVSNLSVGHVALQVACLQFSPRVVEGKKRVSFHCTADGGFDRTIEAEIFVSSTKVDDSTGVITISVPEGMLQLRPKMQITPTAPDPPDVPMQWHRSQDSVLNYLGPALLDEYEADVIYNTPYTGKHGPLAFEDPWWKVAGVVAMFVGAIGRAIADYVNGDMGGIAVGGSFEETPPNSDIKCCRPKPFDPSSGLGNSTAAKVFSVIGIAGALAAMSDGPDPWRRGQAATEPEAGKKTDRELVSARITYPTSLDTTSNYSVRLEASFRRHLDDGTLMTADVSATEVYPIGDVDVEVTTPSPIVLYPDNEIVVQALYRRKIDGLYTGSEVYAWALLVGPNGLSAFLPLSDSDRSGIYVGRLHSSRLVQDFGYDEDDIIGEWQVWSVAQTTNRGESGMLPEEAATKVGGYPITEVTSLVFEDGPCPLKPDLTIGVRK